MDSTTSDFVPSPDATKSAVTATGDSASAAEANVKLATVTAQASGTVRIVRRAPDGRRTRTPPETVASVVTCTGAHAASVASITAPS